MKARTGHLFKRGNRYTVRWMVDGKIFTRALRDADGNPITEKKPALAARDRLLEGQRKGDEVQALEAMVGRLDSRRAELARLEEERNPGLTIAEGWGAYLRAANRPDTGAATLRQYEFQYDRLRRWMEKTHPDATRMRDITPAIAGDFLRHLQAQTMSPRTCNAYLNLLALVWRVLAEPARAAVNPWTPDHLARKKQENGTGRHELPVDVLRDVVEKADGEMRTLFAVGLYCGLRLGDACRLAWEEVDLDRGAIVTTPHKTAGTSGAMVAIPISAPLRRVLETIRPAKPRGPIMPTMADMYTNNQRQLVRRLQQHFTDCGIQTVESVANRKRPRVVVGFHSLRHSFISHAAMAGWPESLVRAIVGHASPAVTRRYLHLQTLAAKSLPELPDVLAPESQKALPEPAPVDWRTEVRRIMATTSTLEEERNALALLVACGP